MFQDTFKKRYTAIPLATYRANCPTGVYGFIAHQHSEAELLLVKEGCVDFYVGCERYHLQQGEALVIPPHSVHRAPEVFGHPTLYKCICFSPKLLCDTDLQRMLDGSTQMRACHITDDRFCRYIDAAFLAHESRHSGWELEAVGNLSLLFAALKKRGTFSAQDSNAKHKVFGRTVMAYIDEAYTQPITSAAAAQVCHISHSYFCRQFKAVFGSSFEKYLLSYRLEKAGFNLQNTSYTITEIAYRNGFHSGSYFSKVFKEKYGVTPLVYRKNHR